VSITKDPEEALKRHDTACRDTPVSPEHAIWYTDGSGYQGLVGGSAVSPRSGRYLQRYLGTEAQASVYAAELAGINTALGTTLGTACAPGLPNPVAITLFPIPRQEAGPSVAAAALRPVSPPVDLPTCPGPTKVRDQSNDSLGARACWFARKRGGRS